MNPYNCPESIYEHIINGYSGMLRAVQALGPDRVQWGGVPPVKPSRGPDNSDTCWIVDGERKTVREIFDLAGHR